MKAFEIGGAWVVTIFFLLSCRPVIEGLYLKMLANVRLDAV